MYYVKLILCCFVVWHIVMMPVRFAAINKKSNLDIARVRAACWIFGWTGVAWMWAMWLAFAPNPPKD